MNEVKCQYCGDKYECIDEYIDYRACPDCFDRIMILISLVLLPLRMYHGWVMTSATEKNSNQSHTVEKEPQESLTNKEFTLAMEDLYHENNRGQMRDT